MDCENVCEEIKNYLNWRYELCNFSFEMVIFFIFLVDDLGWNKNGVFVIVLSKDVGVGYYYFD